MSYIHLLGLVLAGVDSSLHTVSKADRAWGMIFKSIANSEQLWWLQKLFTVFLGITLSAKYRATLFQPIYFLKLSSPGICGQWLAEVLLRKRIWKELLRLLIQGSLESSCPAPPAITMEENNTRECFALMPGSLTHSQNMHIPRRETPPASRECRLWWVDLKCRKWH